jgi:restriction endonuclease Mrr
MSPLFRKSKVVRDGYLVQWQIFRGVLEVRKLATAQEIESTAELYETTTSNEIARKIRSLTGIEFERFLTAVLSRLSEYRNIRVTQASRDGGIDFRGYYMPPNLQQTPLIGQAKQVGAPVSASAARDFIGALDTAGEQRAFGLFVSTGGFTDAAIAALEKSRYHIMRWDMKDVLMFSRGIASCRIEVSFEVPDEAFWNEVIGSA